MHRFGRIVFLFAVGITLAWGVTHAYISKHQQKRDQILAACKSAREKLSPEEKKALEAKCATPEISLVSPSTIKPGDTVEVTITGKFPAGTSFVFQSDSIEVLKESVAANSYKATIKAGPDAGPENISVAAFVPVCCKSAYRSNGLSITGSFDWELKAANGWTVKAHSLPAENRSRELSYILEFYRGAETTPFNKRRATLNPSQSDPPSYYFSISNQDEAAQSVQDEFAKIGQQMQNPNLSDADREKLLKRMEELSAAMTKDIQKMSDPAYLKQLQQKEQQKEQEFGCRAINLKLQNGALTGNMLCSQKVGQSINLTGTMKYLGK